MHGHQRPLASLEWLRDHHSSKLQYRYRSAARWDIQPNYKILDLCCGIGAWTPLFASRLGEEGHYVGIDDNQELINACKSALPISLGKIDFCCSSAYKIPAESSYFDFCLLANCLAYIDDLDELFLEIKRVLKPRGMLTVRHWDYFYTYYSHVPTALQLRILSEIAQADQIGLTGISSFLGLKLGQKLSTFFDIDFGSQITEISSVVGPLRPAEVTYLLHKAQWMSSIVAAAGNSRLAEEWSAYFSDIGVFNDSKFQFSTVECEISVRI